MSDEPLLDKSIQVVTDRQNRLEATKFLKEKYNITNPKHLKFFIQTVVKQYAYQAYKAVYGEHMSNNVARVRASSLMKKYKIDRLEWLELCGHGMDSVVEALQDLKDNDSDKYLKHLTNIKQWDMKRVEHTGDFTIKFEKDLDD